MIVLKKSVSNNIVIVTDSRVWSKGEGRHYRFTRLVQGLCSYGFNIDFITSRKNLSKEDKASLYSIGIRNIITGEAIQASHQKRKFYYKIRKWVPKSVIVLYRIIKKSRKNIVINNKVRTINQVGSSLLPLLLEQYVKKNNPEFILVEYIFHSYALEFLQSMSECARPVTMIDTHDVAHQRNKSLIENGVSISFSISEKEEKDLLNKYDIIIAIQDNDRKIFQKMLPHKHVVTCLPSFSKKPIKPSNSQTKSLVFVGGDYLPNVKGLEKFIENAWPLIKKMHPEVSLKVYGTVCNRFADKSYPGISFRDYVNDIKTAYVTANIVISPIYFGSGLKIKVLEGLGYGRPVVALEHSAIGLSDAVGNGLFVASDWLSFAKIVNKLLLNPKSAKAEGEWAANYISRFFNNTSVMESLIRAMNKELEKRSRNHI